MFKKQFLLYGVFILINLPVIGSYKVGSHKSGICNPLAHYTNSDLYKNLSNSINRLIKNKADLNKVTPFGTFETPLLIYLAKNKFPDLIARIVTAGADIHIKTVGGDAFSIMFLKGEYLMAQFLLEQGAKVDNTDVPLLVRAVQLLAPEYAKLLLAYGVDVNQKDIRVGINQCKTMTTNHTALHIAVERCFWNRWQNDVQNAKRIAEVQEKIRLLLSYGADINLKNENNETPIDIAYRVNSSIAEYIINFRRDSEQFALEDFAYYFMSELTGKLTHEMVHIVASEPFAINRCSALAALKNS